MNLSKATAQVQAQGLLGNASTNILNTSVLYIYNGSIPATPEAAPSGQTLLATVTLANPAFGTPVNGVLTANAITGVTIAATMMANWFRWCQAGGNPLTPTSVIGDGYVGASSGYSAWAANTAYTAGTSFVTNGGGTYICTTSGTSATTGSGPTVKTSGINDGTVVWAYVDLLINATSLVSGATLNVASFSHTVPSV